MTDIERMNFVLWAVENCPKNFTHSRRAYTQAQWDYRKYLRSTRT